MLAFILLTCLPAALGFAWHPEQESRLWITLLFFTPLVLQAVGLWTLRQDATSAFWGLNYWATLSCQSVYCWLWVAYSEPSLTGQAWSYVALASTIVVLGFVIIMTFAVMRASPSRQTPGGPPVVAAQAGQQAPPAPQPGGVGQVAQEPPPGSWEEFFRALSAGVGAHPFWSITFFMSLFLGVSYLFGFALAFHDRDALAEAKSKPALYMVKHESIDDKYIRKAAVGQSASATPANTGGGQTIASLTPATSMDTRPPGGGQEEFCFHFEEVKANVNQKKYGCNSCSLDAVVKSLTEKVEQGRRVKVTLLVHTDNEPIRIAESAPVRYLSNYELSEARSQNVQHEVLRRLSEKLRNLENIQWAIYPAADEPLYQINHRALDKVAVGDELARYKNDEKNLIEDIDRKLPKEEKRVVIATVDPIEDRPIVIGPEQLRGIINVEGEQLVELQRIKSWQNSYADEHQPKPLRLMDYVYFSIYTITTTGYGDIVPNTAYAKFVTSVANIFEVIFLVVFFNAILSLKGRPDDPERGPAAQIQLPDDQPGSGVTGQTNPAAVVSNISHRRSATP